MKPHDIGTLPGSVLYAHIPSAAGKELAFYPVYLGHYMCDTSYCVDRRTFDCFLLMYITHGTGYVETEGRRRTLQEGDIVVLDCYAPHRYAATGDGWEIEWIHFDGPMARHYYELAAKNGCVLRMAGHYAATHSLRKLLTLYKDRVPAPELRLSKYITDLLTDVILCAEESRGQAQQSAVVEESIRYISDHLDRDISVELLARQAMLSPFYFSRLFKRETGFTPHRYLVMVRLDYSRYLLRSSPLTVKEVAFRCGFNSESHFCTCFRQQLGMTPQEYRDEQ